MSHAIRSRNDLIAFGGILAAVLEEKGFGKPWIITVDGDADSGKGLLALAIDRALNPQRYPDGLTKNLSADTLLASRNGGQPQIVFCNFYKANAPGRGKNLQDRLLQFKIDNPEASILIAANGELHRHCQLGQMLDLAALGVDIHLEFKKHAELFAEFPCSDIDISASDSSLANKIFGQFLSNALRGLGNPTNSSEDRTDRGNVMGASFKRSLIP